VKPKLLIVYLVLIILPLVVLGWLGARAMSQEREMVDSRVEGLLNDQLRVYDSEIQAMLDVWTGEWEQMAWDLNDVEGIRGQLRKDGRISQFFSVDQDGILVYPYDNSLMTSRELKFLTRSESVWTSGAIHPNQLVKSDSGARLSKSSSYSQKAGVSLKGQWYEWFWGDGLQMLYWWPTDSGTIHGVEVNRVRLLADMIGELPDSPGSVDGGEFGTRLLDESGHMLYQWGDIELDDDQAPTSRISLTAPLGAWALHGYMDVYSGTTTSNVFVLAVVLVCLALVVSGLGIYFYRENTRELREAAQRVNFVNHVSHELKTPLTNIRMYAELMQDEMEPKQEKAGTRLEVILSESQRLSRLITNVLTFNRKQSRGLSLRPSMVDLDAHIRQVLGHFEKSFEQHQIKIHLDCHVTREVRVDPDIVEQIVSNLLSNVEKYARNSGEVRIQVTGEQDRIVISVEDNGPGIPASEQGAIFDAFYRIHNDLTEGVAGTGIGLSIARDLARLHGGDLELVPSASGAHFKVTLAVHGESQ
jgi:signal transduction histidine kinase